MYYYMDHSEMKINGVCRLEVIRFHNFIKRRQFE